MGFFKKTPAEQINKKIDEEYWQRFNKVKKNSPYSKEQKKILMAILTSSKIIAWSLVQSITHPEYDLSKYVDKDADPFDLFSFAIYIQLSVLNSKLNNEGSLGKKVTENFDWIIENISNVLEMDADSYFQKLLDFDTKSQDEGIDPRDLWVEQDVGFYKKLFEKHFDFEKYIEENPAMNLTLPMLSQNIRVNSIESFNKALDF